MFMSTLIVSNLKIFIISNSFNFWIFFITIASFLTFVLSFFVISVVPGNSHYELFGEVCNSPTFYIAIFMIIVVCSFFDYLWTIAQKILFFNYVNFNVPEF